MKESETIELILNESRKLQKVLNDDLLIKFAELHNINQKNSRFNLKQEIVAKRGLFLDSKKQYALWIVNNEGVPCEEFIEKGLVTRRSDYPSYTKKKMRTILDLLLKEDKISFKKIARYIKDVEHDIKGLILKGDKSISASKTFSKELTGPKKYKRIPHHVLGMLLWNKLEYDYFVTGTKGYLFRINGIDPYLAPKKIRKQLGKVELRWVVLPYEEDKLPDYYQVDVQHMINLAWRDRVNELLKPIIHRVSKAKDIEKKSMTTF